MLRRLCAFLLVGLLAANSISAGDKKASHKEKLPNLSLHDTYFSSNVASTPVLSKPDPCTFDDYVGAIDTAGTTWYDHQHNGSCGRMIDLDESGMVSIAWMNGLTESPTGPRYVYANFWDPLLQDFVYGSNGCRIDNSQRAGFVCQTALGNGLFCFAFHQRTTGSNAHAAAAIPPIVAEPDWCMVDDRDVPIIWPKIDADINRESDHGVSSAHLLFSGRPRI